MGDTASAAEAAAMGQLLSAIRGMDPGFELDLSPPPPAPSPEDPAEAEIYATMASWLR